MNNGRKAIVVVEAKWGTGNSWVDVTKNIRVIFAKGVQVAATLETVGGIDPTEGLVKTLTIRVENAPQKLYSVRENLVIPAELFVPAPTIFNTLYDGAIALSKAINNIFKHPIVSGVVVGLILLVIGYVAWARFHYSVSDNQFHMPVVSTRP